MPVYFEVDDMIRKMRESFREMQRISLPFSSSQLFPIDLENREKKLILKADIPGLNKKDITVKATPTELMISAKSSQEIRKESGNYLRQERKSRQFKRILNLPSEINPDKIIAKYQNGVLVIEMEKMKDIFKRDVNIE